MEASAFKFDAAQLAAEHSGKNVILVGNGETGMAYQPDSKSVFTGPEKTDAKLWVVNNGFMRLPTASLVWSMDDLKGPAWNAHRQRNLWFEALRKAEIPVMTAQAYEEYPATVTFPIQQVAETLGLAGYYAETIDYALAWGLYAGIASLEIHGCDYWEMDRRAQRACAEFWLGWYASRRIPLRINEGSKLITVPYCDQVNRHVPGFYGYLTNPLVDPRGSQARDEYMAEEAASAG